ncbi:hypothetical protein L596_012546 [Steinernema carpocapsae]|uniref:EF-hand domain-containing protein n=1 Tax=Steinernema carpocapsae TaxID=34508 RepID=A0A4U5NXZ9_STECR|nr:hypothetical protein L596_012546 [Steinernema carpocapsae]
MEYQFTEKQKKKYQDAFDEFDKDNDGFITETQLGLLLRQFGQNPTEGKLIESTGGRKKINFNIFLGLMKPIMKEIDSPDFIRPVFAKFDPKHTGFVSEAQFRSAMTTLGKKLTHEEVDEMIKIAGKREDGLVNYSELVKMMAPNP